MYTRKPNINCLICNTAIYRRPSTTTNGVAYCSKKCYGESCRKPIPCVICGKEILAGLNKKTCSKKCKLENDKSINRIHSLGRKRIDTVKWGTRSFRTRFLEERGTVCEECGYNKTPVLQIHHVVERSQGGTDDFSNLKLLCRNCHGEIHFGLRTLN
jgi:5-methylcytosine-specific restriction endonuclease McrA